MDVIADLLTRIRNAKDAKHRFVDIAYSKMNVNIIDVIKKQGFIDDVLVSAEKRKIRVFLRYRSGRQSVVRGLRRISKPGLRKYVNHKDIPHVLRGLGIAILSTSKGVIDGENARRQNVGGELLCYVW